ncbi:NADPH-adrenodoxin reductase KNAG_0C04840 [Huiozyma naganishii CBS 8797]|uniref:NADPH:adrenodoxin oxidoreductase, mitochondrial n=1 Tax=Huiozyma naganishii (strain ATCC MYA-139 / BCRC 22969 / CBS 8797 / KCTC 17520 / NBRC 10181 / NCYC 3082 / Yp74L-3) TaxID=1071383 RepID=J7R422_HUIN7|nr:hypothetical protein KNAG_0C04840 [Kazachstania naganishii CBS 8797]CCK69585.1 hypothetical protein KNAG_0C04840 [Kazachstania naganishii CBS 8797]
MLAKRHVSIIGSGPSGFYTAYRLLRKSRIPLHVQIWEKLPVPFGLSRYGVAPDHPEVKNCEETFESCAKMYIGGKEKSFEFIGGVEVGKDVALNQLIRASDAVVFSYGCSGDKRLGIPGESQTKGVFTSREFVNWYNGYFDSALDDKFSSFPWEKVKRVGIIGNGNVALDIARVLLSNKIDSLWSGTDISTVALDSLRQCPVEEVKLIGRRDFLHSKFTNKELREMWQLEEYGAKGFIDARYFQPERYAGNDLDRAMKRRLEMCSEYLSPFDQRTKKNYKKVRPGNELNCTWELDYLKTPLKITPNGDGTIRSLTLCENVITPENQLIPQSQTVEYDMDLLITSLGYNGRPLNGFDSLEIGFDRDHIANRQGRVLQENGNTVIDKLYASGWIRHGPHGVIASTMSDAFDVADIVLEDLESQPVRKEPVPAGDLLALSRIPHTTWFDWERINEKEIHEGTLRGKNRSKLLTLQDVDALLKQAPTAT